MAGFKQHMTVSSSLGVITGVGATFGLGFTPAQGILAGYLTAVGGMLPDLDSDTGRPVRELFCWTAAVAPLLLMQRLKEWGGGDLEVALMMAAILYVLIRFLGGWLLGRLTVHRGMFHSFPAMFITAEIVFLAWKSEVIAVRLLMAVAISIGFLSHLVLDEIYSVQLNGVVVELNKAAGSAMKFFSSSFYASLFTWLLLAGLSWASYAQTTGIEEPFPGGRLRDVILSIPGNQH